MKSLPALLLGVLLGTLATAGSIMLFRRGQPAPQGSSPDSHQASKTSGAPAPSEAEKSAPVPIIVNGRELTDQDRKMFLDTYKVEPAPGKYWYDAKSGLWDLAGGPAAGFLLAGHSLGKLEPNASNGDSDIY